MILCFFNAGVANYGMYHTIIFTCICGALTKLLMFYQLNGFMLYIHLPTFPARLNINTVYPDMGISIQRQVGRETVISL